MEMLMTQIVNKLAGAIGDNSSGGAAVMLLRDIYGDVAKPSIKHLGDALSMVAETSTSLLLPLKFWNERRRIIFQNNLDKFQLEITTATKQGHTVIPAAPEVANVLVDKLTYVSDDALVDLMVKLLRRVSIEDECKLAHPRFVEIVSNLSPDEARILKCTSRSETFRIIGLVARKESDSGGITETLVRRLPCRCLTGLEARTKILFPENMYKYLISMQSLGLLTIHEDTTLDEFCPPLRSYSRLRSLYSDKLIEGDVLEDGSVTEISYGRIHYTAFGLFFIAAAIGGPKRRGRAT
jgi:hypothetical protein